MIKKLKKIKFTYKIILLEQCGLKLSLSRFFPLKECESNVGYTSFLSRSSMRVVAILDAFIVAYKGGQACAPHTPYQTHPLYHSFHIFVSTYPIHTNLLSLSLVSIILSFRNEWPPSMNLDTLH